MTIRPANRFDSRIQPAAGTQAGARTILVILVAFLLGACISAFWFYQRKPVNGNPNPAEEGTRIRLSDTTREVLGRLDSPVEVRFYSLLDPASTPDSTKAFAQRVDQLLAQYVQEANGKLKLTHYDSMSQANENAALADGIKGFDLDKGEGCYLGVAVSLKGQKVSVPQLSPQWEPALESDLTRAISQVIDAARAATAPAAVSQVNTAAVDEVKAMIPDVTAVSVQEGTRIIRASALKEFQAAAKDLAARVTEAQQQLADAQNGKSEAEQQAAMQHLQHVQAEQSQKLKDIAAKAQSQIEALQQLKAKP